MSLFRKIVPAVDTEPGITDPSYEEMFLPPDPTLEAVAPTERDLLDILEEISANTRGNNDDPGIIWQHVFSRLPAGAGETSLLASERVRNIYIPNAPRPMTVYSGSSRGLFLGKLVIGDTLQVELPYFTNGVFIEYESGGANEQINVYLSSKSIDIGKQSENIGFARLQAIDGTTWFDVSSMAAIDSRSVNQRGLHATAYPYMYNGASWDRQRGDIANGLDVDVTRLPVDPLTLVPLSSFIVAGASSIIPANPKRKRLVISVSAQGLSVFNSANTIRVGYVTPSKDFSTSSQASLTIRNDSTATVESIAYEEVAP